MHKVLIFLLFLLPVYSASSEQVNENSNEKTLVRNTVISFYKDYIEYMANGASDDFLRPKSPSESNTKPIEPNKLGLIEYLNTRADIDKDFIKKTDRMLRELVKEHGEMAIYDPIILAQDIPALDYSEPEINDNHATVIIYRSWGWNVKSDNKAKDKIDVSLTKADGIWKITNIVDTSVVE